MLDLAGLFRSNLALLTLEFACAAILCLAAAWVPIPNAAVGRAETLLRRIPLGARTAICLVFGLTLVLRLLLLPISPVPVPGIHDEFSYLLAGDTFAHGRLANPMNPSWQHFESFHILQTPSYASMYPPAQGLFLALGQALTGYPWAGVLLSIALLSAAVCWMLQVWLSAKWALLGGFLCTLRYGVASYWIDSYWGGAVAALGGVLVLGSLARAVQRPHWLQALWFSLGAFLLASSRPYEGLIFFLPVCGWFLFQALQPNFPRRLAYTRFVAPAICLILIGACWMAFYFRSVTGSALQMPYNLNEKQYQVSRPFVWQTPRPVPFFRHDVMKKYYVEHATMGNGEGRGVKTLVRESLEKLLGLVMFYFWPGSLVVLIGLPLAWKQLSVRLSAAVFVIVWIGLSLEAWPMQLHYSAPILAATTVLTVEALRTVYYQTWRGRPIGRSLVLGCLLVTAGALGVRVIASVRRDSVTQFGWVPWATSAPGNLQREAVVEMLKTLPGKQLVLVRYSPNHHVDTEWVYNPADLPNAKVIFAREMGPERDRELPRAFPDRYLWEISPDNQPAQLQRLRAATSIAPLRMSIEGKNSLVQPR